MHGACASKHGRKMINTIKSENDKYKKKCGRNKYEPHGGEWSRFTRFTELWLAMILGDSRNFGSMQQSVIHRDLERIRSLRLALD